MIDAIDPSEAMRQRLQAGFRPTMQAQKRVDVVVLRVLIAAIDNAGAVPPMSAEAFRRHQVPRRALGVSDVQPILRREYEARRKAADQFARLG